MARFNGIVDLHWYDSGDFSLDYNGDIKGTKTADKYRAFIQRVKTVIESGVNDWPLEKVGAGLQNLLGMENTAEPASWIQKILSAELTKNDLLKTNEFKINIFPLSPNVLALFLTITLPDRQEITLNYNYQLRDNKTIPRLVKAEG